MAQNGQNGLKLAESGSLEAEASLVKNLVDTFKNLEDVGVLGEEDRSEGMEMIVSEGGGEEVSEGRKSTKKNLLNLEKIGQKIEEVRDVSEEAGHSIMTPTPIPSPMLQRSQNDPNIAEIRKNDKNDTDNILQFLDAEEPPEVPQATQTTPPPPPQPASNATEDPEQPEEEETYMSKLRKKQAARKLKNKNKPSWRAKIFKTSPESASHPLFTSQKLQNFENEILEPNGQFLRFYPNLLQHPYFAAETSHDMLRNENIIDYLKIDFAELEQDYSLYCDEFEGLHPNYEFFTYSKVAPDQPSGGRRRRNFSMSTTMRSSRPETSSAVFDLGRK